MGESAEERVERIRDYCKTSIYYTEAEFIAAEIHAAEKAARAEVMHDWQDTLFPNLTEEARRNLTSGNVRSFLIDREGAIAKTARVEEREGCMRVAIRWITPGAPFGAAERTASDIAAAIREGEDIARML